MALLVLPLFPAACLGIRKFYVYHMLSYHLYGPQGFAMVISQRLWLYNCGRRPTLILTLPQLLRPQSLDHRRTFQTFGNRLSKW